MAVPTFDRGDFNVTLNGVTLGHHHRSDHADRAAEVVASKCDEDDTIIVNVYEVYRGWSIRSSVRGTRGVEKVEATRAEEV